MVATEPAAGIQAVVSGWGALSSGNTTLPLQLQAVHVNITVRTTCTNTYGTDHPVTNNMVCAGEAGAGICNGDMGSPLVVSGVLVGIASWGIGCAEDPYPGVYTSIAKLKSFVTQVTGVS